MSKLISLPEPAAGPTGRPEEASSGKDALHEELVKVEAEFRFSLGMLAPVSLPSVALPWLRSSMDSGRSR